MERISQRSLMNILMFKVFLYLFTGIFFLCGNLQASPLSKGVAVISSRYKPYLDILDGIKESVKIPVDAMYLEDGAEIAVSKINDKGYDFAIGIGLQSYEFLKKHTKNMKLFYSLLVYEDKNNCGVYLQPDASQLIGLIKQYRDVKEIFIPFSESSVQTYLEDLKKYSSKESININIFSFEKFREYSLKGEKLPIYDTLIFIPDKIFFSEIVVKDFFDKLNRKNLFIFGYNPFFCNLGGDLCIEHDFKKMGEQTAELVKYFSSYGSCNSVNGQYKVIEGKYEK